MATEKEGDLPEDKVNIKITFKPIIFTPYHYFNEWVQRIEHPELNINMAEAIKEINAEFGIQTFDINNDADK